MLWKTLTESMYLFGPADAAVGPSPISQLAQSAHCSSGISLLQHVPKTVVTLSSAVTGKHDGAGEEGHPGGGAAAAEGQRGEAHGGGVCRVNRTDVVYVLFLCYVLMTKYNWVCSRGC